MPPVSPQVRRRVRLFAVRLLIIVALVFAVLQLRTPSSAVAASNPIIGVGSGRCLDVVGARQVKGAAVAIYDCRGRPNQSWTLTHGGELRAFGGALCLDVVGQDITAPAKVDVWTCTGETNQRWRLNRDGTIVGVQSGLCLDVTGSAKSNNTPVALFTCKGQPNQQWRTATPDTVSPTAPGAPRAIDLSCSAVSFRWNVATDDVGVDAYVVFRDGKSIKTVDGRMTTVRLTVKPGVTWTLSVAARDAARNLSAASAAVVITPPPCRPGAAPRSAPSGGVTAGG